MGLHLGLIGAGSVAGPHLQGLMRVPGLGRIVIVDPNEETLRQKQTEFPQVETATDYRTVLEDPEIQMVDICLPHHLHRDVAIEALEAGKDVFCEKPIATRLEDAVEMVTTADRLGRRSYVSLNQMFTPAHRKAKELIEQGALGKILMGVWKMMGDEFARMNIREHWKGDIEKLLEDRDSHLHAGLRLLHPDSFPLQIDPVPSEQNTGLDTLPRGHAEVEEDTHLSLVFRPGIRVIESPQEFPFLLTSKGLPTHCAAGRRRRHASACADRQWLAQSFGCSGDTARNTVSVTRPAKSPTTGLP